MGVESAELVKHGVNAFLALSITFANELAGIAERVGADAAEVERGLKTESRIGPRAYLRPGGAFAGGTLARDIEYLTQIGEREGVPTQLLGAVRASNEEHKRWARAEDRHAAGRRGRQAGGPRHRGLGPCLQAGNGHSAAFELCRAVPGARPRRGRRQGARLGGPRRSRRPLGRLHALHEPARGGGGGLGVVIQTDWPAYREIDPKRLVAAMRSAIVVDPNGFLLEDARRRRRSAVRQGRRERRVTGVLAGQGRDRHRRQPRARARDRAHVSRSRAQGARLRARRDRARARANRARIGGARAGARSRPPRPTSRSPRRSTVSSPMRSSASRRSTCW